MHIIDTFIHFIDHILLPWGAMGVFAAAVLEEVVAPIPSPTVFAIAGFVFLRNLAVGAAVWKLLIGIMLPGAIGLTLGSLVIYYLAYILGDAFVDRFGKYLGVGKDDFEKLNKLYKKTGLDEMIVLVGRVIPVVPSVSVAIFAGLTRIRLPIYIVYTFFGACVRVVFFAVIGWQFGYGYKLVAGSQHIEDIVGIGILIVVAGFGVYFLRRLYKKRQLKKFLAAQQDNQQL